MAFPILGARLQGTPTCILILGKMTFYFTYTLCPQHMGDKDPSLVRAFEHMGPAIQLPVWLVCHQELRTNLRVRRVFDFIAEELMPNFR
jgi:DNA-binding transcriptional LysR family regulator